MPFTDDILDKFMLDYLQKIGVNGEPSMVNQKALRFLRAELDQKAIRVGGQVIKSFGVISFDSKNEAEEALRITRRTLKDFFKSKEGGTV